MSCYAIGMGGSGARSMEALIYLCAAGLGPESLTLVFVDPDESNHSWKLTGPAASQYDTLQKVGRGDCRLFGTNVTLPSGKAKNVWTPFEGIPEASQRLDLLFGHDLMEVRSRLVYEELYSPRQREAHLNIGFQGNPSIGAAVLADSFDVAGQPWSTAVNDISGRVARGQQAWVFGLGSIFGGTGTTGMRAIPKMIHESLVSRMAGQDDAARLRAVDAIASRVSWGGAFLLPYFTFQRPEDPDARGIGPDPNSFSLRAKQSLEYLCEHAREPALNRIYAIGVQESAVQQSFSLGGNTQTNQPHVVEFLAALSALDFYCNCTPATSDSAMVARHSQTEFTWRDVPPINQPPRNPVQVQPALGQLARMSFAYLRVFYPCLEQIRDRKRVGDRTPWFVDLLETRGVRLDSREIWEVLDAMKQLSASYLGWLRVLHLSPGTMQVRLAHIEAFPDPSFPDGEPDGNVEPFDEEGFATLALEPKLKRRSLANVWRRMSDQSAGRAMPGVSGLGYFFKALFEACN